MLLSSGMIAIEMVECGCLGNHASHSIDTAKPIVLLIGHDLHPSFIKKIHSCFFSKDTNIEVVLFSLETNACILEGLVSASPKLSALSCMATKYFEQVLVIAKSETTFHWAVFSPESTKLTFG